MVVVLPGELSWHGCGCGCGGSGKEAEAVRCEI